MRIINADDLVNDTEKSMQENPHKDTKVAQNHQYEHMHFLNLISQQDTIERYKVYEIDSKCSYIGTSLVAARTAEEANEYIESYREFDKDNKGNSWGYSDVGEDDVIENLWSEESGIIKHGIYFHG